MEFINHHIFETIYLIFHQYYFTFFLGIIIVVKFRITGVLLLAHAIVLYTFITNYNYELYNVNDLYKQAYGYYYEENIFFILNYGFLLIPYIVFLGIFFDWLFLRKKCHL